MFHDSLILSNKISRQFRLNSKSPIAFGIIVSKKNLLFYLIWNGATYRV